MFDGEKCPTYLVSDKENAAFDEYALTNLYTLKSLIQTLCTNLKHPVAVFDFVRLKKDEQSKYSQKIESDISFFSLRNSCKLLRQCAGDRFCEECDRFHASCMASSADEIRANIAARFVDRPDFFYGSYVKRPPRVLELDGCDRPILEYHCPMMGYRELIFPIRYKGRVFGVLFVGQISVQSSEDPEKGDLRVIDGIRRGFFENNDPNSLFFEFVERFNKGARSGSELSGKELEAWIMESDQNPNKYDRVLNFGTTPDQLRYHFRAFESKTAYDDYLRTVCKEIEQMELALGQDYANNRSGHFDQLIQEITKPFYERLDEVRKHYKDSNPYERYTAELTEMWDAIKRITVDIQERFSAHVRSVTVYGDGESLTVGNVNVKPAQFSFPSGNMSTAYDFTIVRGSGAGGAVNSITFQSGVKETEHPEGGKGLLDGLSNGVPRKDCVLIACRSIAVFLRVRDLQKYSEIYKALAEAIGKELEEINDAVVLSRANLQKEKHVLTLRMYRHETAHISERLSNLTDRYLTGSGSLLRTITAMTDEKRWRVVNDMHNTISLLSDMADNVGLVTGSINENSPMLREREELDVFDMLYKWRSMFHYQLADRNLEILVPRGGESGDRNAKKAPRVRDDVAAALNGGVSFVEGKRYLTINARLFELLVYNLVDNAVKYAYHGSNIYLLWSKTDGGRELRVISFGPPMEPDQNHFALYARGKSSLVQSVQGEGIGLYAVKRVGELLGLTINWESRQIAPYYLPFVRLYRGTDFSRDLGYQKIDVPLPSDPMLERIVVNRHEGARWRKVTRERLRTYINKATYRTTFTINIKTE